MKVEESVEKRLSLYAAEYARVRKEKYILVNKSEDEFFANIERVRALSKLEEELEYSLTFYAMCIAGYEFVEVDGICQYVKK